MENHLDHLEVRWKNFKSFKDTRWIKIKPLTILIGPNNSGKTNFIAPLLLMNQTLNSRDASSPLILKGNIYDGGDFQEIVNQYDLKQDIFFGVRYHLHNTDKKIKKLGSYPPGAFEMTLRSEKNTTGEFSLKTKKIFDVFLQKYVAFSLTKTGRYKYSGFGADSLTKAERGFITNSEPINFLFSPQSLLEKGGVEFEDEDGKITTVERFSEGFSHILAVTSHNYSQVRRYLGTLSFIGPIREYPHRIYEITNETYDTVGPSGENMANLLKKLGDKKAKLDRWIKKFDFGDSLKLEHLYSNSYSIRFLKKNSNLYTSIANAGFGASQVLPLIVQALVSSKGSITVAEQPEIHLNPKLQCVLADLFVYMANSEQKAIIETHSEHLLLRLRRLIAEGKIKSEKVALYFIDKENGSSTIREINIENDGHIKTNEWPKGFFEDSMYESMALATKQFNL